jgi:hypothetical protein
MLKYSDFLNEKSTLPSIGVPVEIMQIVQYDFEFSDNIIWFDSNISDIITFPNITRWQQSNLFVGVSDKKIFFIFAYPIEDKVFYNYDEFHKIVDDFGEGWERETEVKLDIKSIVHKILGFKGKVYYTSSQDYKLTPKIKRKFYNINKSLESKTQIFIDKVKDKLESMNIHFSDRINDNGLTKFDETLLKFEKKYSILKDKYITIEILIDEYGLNKVITSFIYFIKTNKVIDYE